MCGIVGYVGDEQALPVLLNGMQKLEYRGYDSSGVAVINGQSVVSTTGQATLTVERKAGRIGELLAELEGTTIEGTTGIGHTRWATHGAPTDINAHPHRDCSGDLAVVHNGIIENHDELRTRLTAEGHTFKSQTDTEVAVHLIESIIDEKKCSLKDAVLEAVNILEGAFALVCISVHEPDRIIVARQEPPIIVGASAEAGLVGSDIPALLAYTRDVIPLDNYQVAEVMRGSVRVWGFDGIEVTPETVHVEWDMDAAEKGGFEDFMLKEIYEQPEAVRNTMRGRIDDRDASPSTRFPGRPTRSRRSTRSSWSPVEPRTTRG